MGQKVRGWRNSVAKGWCQNCGEKITIQIFIGGDWCSDNCRKALGKDIK